MTDVAAPGSLLDHHDALLVATLGLLDGRADALDHLMGGREAWWDLWESGQPSNALLRRYVERLKSLGYQYVLPQPVRDPVDGRVHYYMIHVTDHPSALGLMRWAKKQTGRIYATELPGTETF